MSVVQQLFMTISMSSGGSAVGQVAYTTAGSFSWVVPAEVTSISSVAIGCGGGNSNQSGGGGALSYKNDISVTPGETLTVTIGTPATSGTPTATSLKRGATLLLNAPSGSDTSSPGAADTTNGATSFAGGSGGLGGGGGGAGGYSGAGGVGGNGVGNASNNGTAGTGGAAGGGGVNGTTGSGGGGGTGLLGQGSNGAGGTTAGTGGGAGSGGTSGGDTSAGVPGAGGLYGGGIGYYLTGGANTGAVGALRIIWGSGRSFPSTNTGNM